MTIEVLCFQPSVFVLRCRYTPLRPAFSPFHAVLLYPVVRTAWEAPVPDGWTQGHGFAVKDELPVGRRKWSHNLTSAPTAAEMDNSPVSDGNVEHFFVEGIRDALDELMIECGH